MTTIALALAALSMLPGVVRADGSFNATFDFDTGIPPLVISQNTPFNQSSGGVSASFSSPSAPEGFSVQTYGIVWYILSNFSGNFLHDNLQTRGPLEIRFNQPITGITMTYATLEYQGRPEDVPTTITLTAYSGSTFTPVGSNASRASWPIGNTYPQGEITFRSSQPFDTVRVELTGTGYAVDFLVDNIRVTNEAYAGYPAGIPILWYLAVGIPLALGALIAIAVFLRRKGTPKKP